MDRTTTGRTSSASRCLGNGAAARKRLAVAEAAVCQIVRAVPPRGLLGCRAWIAPIRRGLSRSPSLSAATIAAIILAHVLTAKLVGGLGEIGEAFVKFLILI